MQRSHQWMAYGGFAAQHQDFGTRFKTGNRPLDGPDIDGRVEPQHSNDECRNHHGHRCDGRATQA